MVQALHAAGLEVILDVVFNHTAEGGADGPTLSLPRARRRRLLPPADDRRATSTTPAAATRSTRTGPRALRLVMDALRYWAQEMHVDGFRFDLAAALGRGDNAFDPHAAFLQAVGAGPGLWPSAS